MGYSFIIPVYNCRDTLADCVGSIRQAGLRDYEILLIDDGSTDGSAALCDQLEDAFPEVRTFHQAHSGVSAARNRGLAEAGKTHILFADGDDTLDGEALQAVLQQSGELLIFGMVMEHWHRGVCYGQEAWVYPHRGQLDWQGNLQALFCANVLCSACNKVFRRALLEEHCLRFREMPLYEDLEFVLRYMKYCQEVVSLPLAAYRYRASGRAGERIGRLGDISVFLQPLEAALADLPLPGKTRDALRLRLFEILAWEMSGMTGGKALCRDFQVWYEGLEEKPEQPSALTRQLLRGRSGWLRLCRGAILLRHALAVEGKTWMKKLG